VWQTGGRQHGAWTGVREGGCLGGAHPSAHTLATTMPLRTDLTDGRDAYHHHHHHHYQPTTTTTTARLARYANVRCVLAESQAPELQGCPLGQSLWSCLLVSRTGTPESGPRDSLTLTCVLPAWSLGP